jgi:hypothetical protein
LEFLKGDFEGMGTVIKGLEKRAQGGEPLGLRN